MPSTFAARHFSGFKAFGAHCPRMVKIKGVRLKVEQNQLVAVFE
jgi:hypothetical protein